MGRHASCVLAVAVFQDLSSHVRQIGSRRGSGSRLSGGLEHAVSLLFWRCRGRSIPSIELSGIGAMAYVEGARVELHKHTGDKLTALA